MSAPPAVHVAVGVIRDGDGNILLTRRASHAHQGGLWEFPGGKLEADESVAQALRRELREEVGITVKNAHPLIKINHRYPELRVLLDVWQVTDFSGTADAREGQAMRWVAPQRLSAYTFPAANLPIITAARLPDRYAILEGQNTEQVLSNLERIVDKQIELLQLRLKTLPTAAVSAVCEAVLEKCKRRGIQVLLNSDLALSHRNADGIHLSSRALLACQSRPPHYQWVAASCHNLPELRHAEQIGADFAVLAPILTTPTHPGALTLGWEAAANLITQVNLPVFFLGGLELADMDRARHAGARGIAGISAFLT